MRPLSKLCGLAVLAWPFLAAAQTPDLARILERLEHDLIDVGEVEARPRMEGNQMFIILGPKKHKGAAKPEHPAIAKPEQPAVAASKPEPKADSIKPADAG